MATTKDEVWPACSPVIVSFSFSVLLSTPWDRPCHEHYTVSKQHSRKSYNVLCKSGIWKQLILFVHYTSFYTILSYTLIVFTVCLGTAHRSTSTGHKLMHFFHWGGSGFIWMSPFFRNTKFKDPTRKSLFLVSPKTGFPCKAGKATGANLCFRWSS